MFVLAVLAAAWTGFWLFVSAQARSEFDQALAGLNRNGVIAQCTNRSVVGYPLSIQIKCDALNYEDDARGVFAEAGAMRSSASVLHPSVGKLWLEGPVRLEAPNFVPLALDWEDMRADISIDWPLPDYLSLTAQKVTGQSDPDDETDPALLFEAATMRANISPSSANLIYLGEFTELQINPDAVGGRNIPPLNGAGEATIIDGVAMLRARPNSFRGKAIQITNLQLASGEGNVSVSGPISIDKAGLIDAKLKVGITNPQALSQALQEAVPEHASEIGTGLTGLSLLSKNLSLPLNIVKGKARLGPIPLGDIPPLE